MIGKPMSAKDDVKVKDCVNRSAAIGLRIEAGTKEFTAAVMMADQNEMTRLRDNLHTLMDAQLDVMAELGVLFQASLK